MDLKAVSKRTPSRCGCKVWLVMVVMRLLMMFVVDVVVHADVVVDDAVVHVYILI